MYLGQGHLLTLNAKYHKKLGLGHNMIDLYTWSIENFHKYDVGMYRYIIFT